MLDGVAADVFFCDLALPHDTDPAIAEIPGVHRLDLAGIAELPQARVAGESVSSAEHIVMDADH